MEQLVTFSHMMVWPYIVIFILLSYTIKNVLGIWLQKITPWEWKSVYTVAIIAIVVGIPYGITMKESWVPMLLSYTVGTSLHEIILKYITEGVTKFFKKIFDL